jgi:hypothetical protein
MVDITVVNGQVHMPPDFGFTKVSIEFVPPDLHAMSQFRVQADDFTNSAVTTTEVPFFATQPDLEVAARRRGIAPAVHALVWPALFRAPPFEEAVTAAILKSCVDEYMSVRGQWLELPKMHVKYNPIVCDAFSAIQVDVKQTHLKH